MKKSSIPTMFQATEIVGETRTKKNQPYKKIKNNIGGALVITLFVFAAGIAFTGCKKKDNDSIREKELNQLRAALPGLSNLKAANAAGYNKEVTGYRTQMGFHYLNESLLDDKFDISKPELVLYAPYGNDSMKFVAVEYATPIKDLNNPPPVPEGFTGSDDVWEINTEFKLWTLHVWVGLDNPHGLFSPHNPRLP